MKATRRGFIAAIVLGLAAPLAAQAQPAGKVWRLGYLSLAPDTGVYRTRFAVFRDALRALGYVEGETIAIERRHADGRLERLSEMAAELVRLKVDVLVSSGNALAARKETSTIPIVFIAEPDPVGTGLVASLAHPGGNATGLADAHTELVPKRLELLKEIVPSATRVGILWNPANPATAPQLTIAKAAAAKLNLTAFPVGVTGPGRAEMDRAFVLLGKERLGALLVVGDQTLGSQLTRIAELAVTHRLPTIGTTASWAEAGLLLAYGANFIDLFNRAVVFVDKILRGAKPGDLPVEQPTKFDLVINLKTAKALGLTIPPSLLLRADQVLE